MRSFMQQLQSPGSIGLLILRLFIGIRLFWGVIDNVVSWEHMLEFRDFLEQFNFPFPMLSAHVSVYAQLIASLAYMIGWKVRYAAGVMVVNFLVALLMVHWGQSFEQMTPPLAMLFISLSLLFTGGGRYALDAFLEKKNQDSTTYHYS
jgi:putative oxidoreductase